MSKAVITKYEWHEGDPPVVVKYLKRNHETWLLFEYRQALQRARELERQALELGLVKRPKLVKA